MTHFLATDENTKGYKLEDILTIIRQDMVKRMVKIVDDVKPEAQQVLKNNVKILGLISECIDTAKSSTDLLNRSFGPSSSAEPRIGTR